jgi:choline-sulfatase
MRGGARDANVLLILSDQHRKSVTGCYGDPLVSTPHIDRLAADGTRLANAFCQSPLCSPSRASLLTGTHPHTCKGHQSKPPPQPPVAGLPTIATLLAEAGYATGCIGKLHVKGANDRYDLGFAHRELDYYKDRFRDYIEIAGRDAVNRYVPGALDDEDAPARDHYNRRNVPVDLDESLMYDALVVERCVGFLEEHRHDRFFLWAGLEKPHPAWYAPAESHAMYDPAEMPLPPTRREDADIIPTWNKVADRYTDDEMRHSIAAYYANVSYMDSKVGELVAAVDGLGLADSTLVIYTTDHGELLFDHGLTQKHCFYEGAVAVPLIFRLPGLVPAARVREPIVSLVDLLPTILELVGLDVPGHVEGRSLADVISGDDPRGAGAATSEYCRPDVSKRMIRTERWKYVEGDGSGPKLFDLAEDPLETANLADDPAVRGVREDLRRRVLAHWERPAPA